MTGTFAVDRSIWTDDLFADEPFTEREAYIWLTSEAGWKSRRKRVGRVIVDLARGQLATSIRFLAQAWKWTFARVQRFLARLKKARAVDTDTDTGVTRLTVCFYDKIQAGRYESETDRESNRYTTDTPTDTQTHKKNPYKTGGSALLAADPDTQKTRKRYTNDTNENKEIKNLESTYVDSCHLPKPINETAEAVEVYNAAAERTGWPKVQKMTPPRARSLKLRIADAGGLDGWRAAIDRAAASDFLCGRSQNRWAGCCFDWLVKPANFTKLTEGNYDNRGKPDAAAQQDFHELFAEAMKERGFA